MLNQELLKRFICIRETRSFTKAAEKLYVSRQALIAQITMVEKELGFPIFERTNRGVVMTAAGKIYIENSYRIMQTYNDMVRQCVETANGVQSIRIGSLPNLPGTSLPKICNEYHRIYPNVKLHLLDYPLESYFELFKVHAFDVMTENMMNYYHNLEDLCFLPLKRIAPHIGVIEGSPLARKRKFKFHDLRGKSILIYKRGIGKAEDIIRNYIEKNEPSIRLIDITSYESSLTTRSILENALVFLYTARSYPGLKSIPTDWDFKIDLGIGYRRNPTPEVSRLLELIEKMNKETDLMD
ncbi:MAG: LysR family transcriptional regulator [Phascolarctobacterium sp.]|nr:LysR family transcriptional regulator [Phascolarctobacterium sp.]